MVAACGVWVGNARLSVRNADRRSRDRQAPVAAVQAVRRGIGENGVGSPVDPYRLGVTMSTRTIAIVALVIVVVVVVILFVI